MKRFKNFVIDSKYSIDKNFRTLFQFRTNKIFVKNEEYLFNCDDELKLQLKLKGIDNEHVFMLKNSHINKLCINFNNHQNKHIVIEINENKNEFCKCKNGIIDIDFRYLQKNFGVLEKMPAPIINENQLLQSRNLLRTLYRKEEILKLKLNQANNLFSIDQNEENINLYNKIHDELLNIQKEIEDTKFQINDKINSWIYFDVELNTAKYLNCAEIIGVGELLDYQEVFDIASKLSK